MTLSHAFLALHSLIHANRTMRPKATSVSGLKLLVYEAFSLLALLPLINANRTIDTASTISSGKFSGSWAKKPTLVRLRVEASV
jgi:hypothetical protein